jgi:hypothetical protein
LTSPPIALPEGAYGLTLQFWNYQAIEDDVSSCWDGGLLELSTDGGQTWRSMSNQLLTDPYDGPVSTVWENPLGGQPAWCGDPQDWLNSIIDLSDFAGQTIRFRFRLGTDQSVSREGWYVDDVMIQACSSVLTLEETVGLEPAQCAADDQITVKTGAEVTYCYRLTNTGSITYTTHTLMTEQFGPLLNQFSYTLPPGASLVITRTATVTETAFNSTTWTAFDETMQTVSTASDAAGVIVKKGDYFLPLIRH